MNTDQPTPREEKQPVCIHGKSPTEPCDDCTNYQPATQPEPAKDEWRIDKIIVVGGSTIIALIRGSEHFVNLQFKLELTQQEAEVIAKQIVEAVKRSPNEVLLARIESLRAELEQARARIEGLEKGIEDVLIRIGLRAFVPNDLRVLRDRLSALLEGKGTA